MSNEERTEAAERLRKLYDSRVPDGISQSDFGTIYGIGSQSMVAQYLSGHRPLNFEAAAKFAKGLRCTIADISPAMARRLRAEIFPVLGKVSLKAAVALALGIPPLLHNVQQFLGCVLCKIAAVRKWLTKRPVNLSESVR